ncbi:hypothetical protein Bbelb_226350 [Branchiostoma belcheri]|nr:hypothetical protein Bbelb_226350 [Branchiostoma belcheri]
MRSRNSSFYSFRPLPEDSRLFVSFCQLVRLTFRVTWSRGGRGCHGISKIEDLRTWHGDTVERQLAPFCPFDPQLPSGHAVGGAVMGSDPPMQILQYVKAIVRDWCWLTQYIIHFCLPECRTGIPTCNKITCRAPCRTVPLLPVLSEGVCAFRSYATAAQKRGVPRSAYFILRDVVRATEKVEKRSRSREFLFVYVCPSFAFTERLLDAILEELALKNVASRQVRSIITGETVKAREQGLTTPPNTDSQHHLRLSDLSNLSPKVVPGVELNRLNKNRAYITRSSQSVRAEGTDRTGSRMP